MKIGSREWSKLIIDGARAFDLDLERHHTELFAGHARELLHWTKTINLTTITDPFPAADFPVFRCKWSSPACRSP
ncbi:MAG: hypothetical protein JRE36_01590 [Deltaproteobacteria bacterium]|nr:hypothetical protein [Deltaproteobacteria bacterium]